MLILTSTLASKKWFINLKLPLIGPFAPLQGLIMQLLLQHPLLWLVGPSYVRWLLSDQSLVDDDELGDTLVGLNRWDKKDWEIFSSIDPVDIDRNPTFVPPDWAQSLPRSLLSQQVAPSPQPSATPWAGFSANLLEADEERALHSHLMTSLGKGNVYVVYHGERPGVFQTW